MAEIERGQELDFLYQELKKSKIQPLYLFYGEEEFLISKAMEVVQKTVLKGIPVDFNFNQYYGKECDIQRVIEACNTLPMMAPRRMVLLRDVHEIKEAALEKLARYTEKPSPTTVLLMVGGKVDARRKFVGNTKKHGQALEFRTLYEKQLRPWIRSELREMGKTVGEDGVTFLIEMVGENLRELHSELLKLSLYVGNRANISVEDMQAVISDVSLDSVFEFVEAVGARDGGRALMQLRRMYENTTDANGTRLILSMYRHFMQLYKARSALSSGLSPREVAAKAGVHEKMFWKWEKEVLPSLQKRSVNELERALKKVYQCQIGLRSSRVPEEIQLEALVMELCR